MDDSSQPFTVDERVLTSVRHDLRTPLVNLTLAAKLLSQAGERDGDLGELIAEATLRLGRISRDLLDFTLLRLGHTLPIQRRPLELRALIERALAELGPSLPQHPLELQPSAPLHGSFDPERSVQLVECLVGHAVRCGTPRGTVRLTLSADDAEVVLRVHVDGAEISAERRDGWFLDQADAGTLDREVGIGPYLARGLAQAHGGSLEVTSSDAEGTVFTLHLPNAASGT